MDCRTAVPPVLCKTKSTRHFWHQRHHEFKELMLTKLASLNPLTKNAPRAYFAHTRHMLSGCSLFLHSSIFFNQVV
jgi:hypothetical protein